MQKNTYNEIKQLIKKLNAINESPGSYRGLTDLYIDIEEIMNDHKSRAEGPGDLIGADILKDLEYVLKRYKREALR